MGSGSKFKRQQKREEKNTEKCNYVESDVGLIGDCRISSNTALNDDDGRRGTFKNAEIITRSRRLIKPQRTLRPPVRPLPHRGAMTSHIIKEIKTLKRKRVGLSFYFKVVILIVGGGCLPRIFL